MRIEHLGESVDITTLIGCGQENAITAKHLALVLGKKSARDVTRIIERERADGIPICACNNGYYLADTPDELSFYISKFDRRQRSMATTRRGLEDALVEMTGQTRMEGCNG